jgi:flagellar biosynthetic protein FlhB
MAESESGQDKTEDPTDKKKKDAREKGEIARSKELNTLAIMLAGAGGLLIFGGALAQDMMELMRLNFSLSREVLLDQRSMGTYLLHSGQIALLAIQPVMITLFLVQGHSRTAQGPGKVFNRVVRGPGGVVLGHRRPAAHRS